jgi:hypothetical protein
VRTGISQTGEYLGSSNCFRRPQNFTIGIFYSPYSENLNDIFVKCVLWRVYCQFASNLSAISPEFVITWVQKLITSVLPSVQLCLAGPDINTLCYENVHGARALPHFGIRQEYLLPHNSFRYHLYSLPVRAMAMASLRICNPAIPLQLDRGYIGRIPQRVCFPALERKPLLCTAQIGKVC